MEADGQLFHVRISVARIWNLCDSEKIMNIFVLDNDPIVAAQYNCDKHVVKMPTEVFQMLGSALRRHGATDQQMPLTKAGTPLIGGYAHHPVTKWVGDSRQNFEWAAIHGIALAEEYTKTYEKKHFCESGIYQMLGLISTIPSGKLTPHSQAVDDCYKSESAVDAYRKCYIYAKYRICKWKNREQPSWFRNQGGT